LEDGKLEFTLHMAYKAVYNFPLQPAVAWNVDKERESARRNVKKVLKKA